MCTGKCSRVVGLGLLPLALTCVVCNLLLCFPDWDTQYLREGGKLLTPRCYPDPSGSHPGDRTAGLLREPLWIFLSILFALVGLAGSVYAVSVSAWGWCTGQPRQMGPALHAGAAQRDTCAKPPGVVRFSATLFAPVLNGLCGTCRKKQAEGKPSPEPKSRVTTAPPPESSLRPSRPGPGTPASGTSSAPRPAEITDSVAPTVCPAGRTPPAPCVTSRPQ
ncbi:unnamed protein product [Natator depressus]